MGFVECEKHGGTIGFMVSEKIDDAIRLKNRKIDRDSLHLVRIAMKGSSIQIEFWMERDQLVSMGLNVKDLYLISDEWEELIDGIVPACKGCLEEILV